MALRKTDVEEWLVNAVMAVYEGAQIALAWKLDILGWKGSSSMIRGTLEFTVTIQSS